MIFMDLHKVYDALDRSRCLGILEGYGMGPRALRLLRLYWVRLRMVARPGVYYGSPFRRERRVTQGDPLLPTIFNLVVDAMVCHWESLLVAKREGGESSNNEGDGAHTLGRTIWDQDDRKQWTEEGRQRLTVKAEFFYADNEVVASTDLGWLQSAFDFLTGLFDWVGLWKNV